MWTLRARNGVIDRVECLPEGSSQINSGIWGLNVKPPNPNTIVKDYFSGTGKVKYSLTSVTISIEEVIAQCYELWIGKLMLV